MKRRLFPFATWILLAGAGCGAPEDRPSSAPAPRPEGAAVPESPAAVSPESPAASAPESAGASVPMRVAGYQVVRVIVRDTGYTPDRIRLEAGVPVKMVFVQESRSHCASQIMIPAMGVPATDLPPGQETVVEFSPAETGTFAFTCGMDMLRGTLEVGA